MDAVNGFLEGVSNQSLCNWFFFMYVLALVGAVLQVVMIIINTTMFLRSKIHASVKGGFLVGTLMALVVLGIAVTNSLFLYSLCDRSLVKHSVA